LRIDKMEDVLQRYLELKVARMHMKAMDPTSAQMLKEILGHPDELGIDEHAYLQNRIMMVLENFFSWMFDEMTKNPRLTRISKEDIDRIRKVEEYLIHDLSKAPGIEDLARFSAMSATRLKTLFRQIYGLPPYEYFQQHRMLSAKQRLKDTRLPIQEIGRSLGYSNMSNFTLAFRKVFKINPSEIR
jgi:AraC-like DNA-binding protein